ncbi:MAG: FGGY family carbohydrate kinase [Thermotogota bacterium]|nr:FGGY family carbohydrate kinase [Thermotogota bacterium]
MGNYIGVDIGTTNIKAVCLNAQGKVTMTLSKKTPYRSKNQVCFFDMTQIEKITDEMIQTISESDKIDGIAFSSVGESVVPIRGNKRVHDPLLWSDNATEKIWQERQDEILNLIPPKISGLMNTKFYSIYKILWTIEMIEGCTDIDDWLPINSYLAFRLTGEKIVDYSQACRMLLLDIHKRAWHKPVLENLDISFSKELSLRYMGSYVGDYKGIKVYIGGHDHIAGLFGITLMMDTPELYYDSMGTADAVALLTQEKKHEMHRTEEFCKTGDIGVGFKDHEYYALKTAHNYGRVMEWLYKTAFSGRGNPDFEDINQRIDLKRPMKHFIMAEADPLTPEWVKGICLTGDVYLNSPEDYILNGYLYLGYLSRYILNFIEENFGSHPEYDYITGGGITNNTLFMQIKTTMLNRKLAVLDTHEITGLGTALAAAKGHGDKETIDNVRNLVRVKYYHPVDYLRPLIQEKVEKMDAFYSQLI